MRYLGGDAKVASSSSDHLATRYPTEAQAPHGQARGHGGGKHDDDRKRPPRGGDGKRHEQERPRGDRIHVIGSNGAYTISRRGRPLCGGFQDGSCTGALCSKGMPHQCGKRMGPGHASNSPYPCRATPTSPKQETPFKGNNSNGKGKGKCRKGRGGWQIVPHLKRREETAALPDTGEEALSPTIEVANDFEDEASS